MGCGVSKPKDKDLIILLNMDRVVLFSKTSCPYSDFVKHMMRETGVDFTVVEIDEANVKPETYKSLIEFTKNKTVPQLFVKGKYIGGMLKVDQLRETKKLKRVLEGE